MQGDHYDNFYEYEPPEPEEEERVDPYVEHAKEDIEAFFEENPKEVVYARQLEIRFERPYFHWVTARAIDELVDEGTIGRERHLAEGGTPVSFLFDPRLRRRRRIIRRKLRVLEEYVKAASVKVRIGDHAEMMFLVGFAERG